jgi:hypothetical protein
MTKNALIFENPHVLHCQLPQGHPKPQYYRETIIVL